ncbi:MAG: YCF48-related protein, partial [Actinomycetota bacterium]|nr:YCF48-related protein [Actinomycetota bacterium]
MATTPTTQASRPGPVPAGFKVQSATFVSADQGWVLGTAACASAPCTSMARTDDGGQRWVGVPAPRDGLADGSATVQTGVSEVRFADDRNGWIFGPDLWSTHDGGTTWNRVTVGSAVSQVTALETSTGEVDAVVTDCAAGSSRCPGQLWHAPVDGDQFTQVRSVQLPDGVAGPSALTLHG